MRTKTSLLGHLLAAVLPVVLLACASPSQSTPASVTAALPVEVVAELRALAEDDQRWEHLVMDQDPQIREPGFFDRKAALMAERADRCAEIFAEYGLPTAERDGPAAASDFWILVQHADARVELQAAVLAAMNPDSVDPIELAYLTDRVRVNQGGLQVYGTQVDYDRSTARPFPKPTEDLTTVDERRAAVGLEPLAEYLNGVAESHFLMNESLFREEGIAAPWEYDTSRSLAEQLSPGA